MLEPLVSMRISSSPFAVFILFDIFIKGILVWNWLKSKLGGKGIEGEYEPWNSSVKILNDIKNFENSNVEAFTKVTVNLIFNKNMNIKILLISKQKRNIFIPNFFLDKNCLRFDCFSP